jgi:hypothetical protein
MSTGTNITNPAPTSLRHPQEVIREAQHELNQLLRQRITIMRRTTFLNYCVTANGNIVQIESPQGHPLISLGEGHGICDLNTQVEGELSFGISNRSNSICGTSHN